MIILSTTTVKELAARLFVSEPSIRRDLAFFSCRGLSSDGYLTDIAPAENNVRQKMIKNAKRSYLLCTSDKFGKKYYHNLCHSKELDGIITNS